MLVGENAVDLAACRAALSRAAVLVDEHRDENPTSRRDERGDRALFAEAQAVKTFVNEAATRVVDRALALSGGAGYFNSPRSPRLPRRPRGAFMHPLGANRAYDHLAQIALGEPAALH